MSKWILESGMAPGALVADMRPRRIVGMRLASPDGSSWPVKQIGVGEHWLDVLVPSPLDSARISKAPPHLIDGALYYWHTFSRDDLDVRQVNS